MRIGTTGTSPITLALIETFIRTENIVVAVQSRNLEKAREVAYKYGVEKAYDNFEKMLEDKDIDTIYVALPNALHYKYAKQALLANKNVICEKPFTTTYAEAKELADIAKEKHLYLFEAILTRHLPAAKALKNSLKEIAPIRMAIFNFSKYSSKYDKFLNNIYTNTFAKEMAGGALMDLNIYNLHLTHLLFGKAEKLNYFANIQRDVDTSGVAVLEYDGFIVNCISAKDSDAKSFGQIMGEKGYINFDNSSSIFEEFELVHHDGTKEHYKNDGLDPYASEIKTFKDIIESDDYARHLEILNDSLEVMEMLEELYK